MASDTDLPAAVRGGHRDESILEIGELAAEDRLSACSVRAHANDVTTRGIDEVDLREGPVSEGGVSPD